MKRTRMKPWRRDPADKVDPADYEYVMRRDGSCIAAQLDPTHRCEGRDTYDHVPRKNENAYGVRGGGGRYAVRLCWGANVNGWASAHRDKERDWLSVMEPDE